MRARGLELGCQGVKNLPAETLPLALWGDGDGFQLGLRGQKSGDGKAEDRTRPGPGPGFGSHQGDAARRGFGR